MFLLSFFFNDTATTEIYTLSLHDALPIWPRSPARRPGAHHRRPVGPPVDRLARLARPPDAAPHGVQPRAFPLRNALPRACPLRDARPRVFPPRGARPRDAAPRRDPPRRGPRAAQPDARARRLPAARPPAARLRAQRRDRRP